jgi:hypothetical protein
LEVQIAMIVLAVGISGLGPLVVIQSRQSAKLSQRLGDGKTEFLNRSTSTWGRKLGIGATPEISSSTATPPLRPQFIDDDNDSLILPFRTVSSGYFPWWYYSTSLGYNGDLHLIWGSNDGDWAQWEVSNLSPKAYDIYVNYYSFGFSSNNAGYRIWDNNTTIATVRVNQRIAPTDKTLNGFQWKRLGTFTISSGTLRVRLLDDTSGYLCADAVWIEPRRNGVNLTNSSKNATAAQMTANVTLTPGS